MQFFSYFLNYIFKAKTRQRLLFMAIIGLLISSFSLVVIQGIMSGLQSGLINRSKKVLGSGVIEVKEGQTDPKMLQTIYDKLEKQKIYYYPEYEIELLLKKDDFIYPVILHGVDFKFDVPLFLKNKDRAGIVMGAELASKLNAYFGSNIQIISPSHTDSIMGELPRHVSTSVTDFFMSELTEIDSVSAWVRLPLVQNLIRQRAVNVIRLYNVADWSTLVDSFENHPERDMLVFKSWEEKNSSLVWALKLETNVMLFLFIGMSFLVAITITSGFMIFFDKVKTDLISFWILGKSQKQLMRLSYIFTHFLSIIFCGIGIIGGLLFLTILKQNDINFMPDFFVERSIPVNIETNSVIISFFVPYLIAAVFSYFSFNFFKKENQSFLKLIRKVG
jgi:lipoprotein-releasing system permease protein